MRTRLLLALALLGLFCVVPSLDATSGTPYLGYLRVREWLLAADGPLQPWLQQGTVPPLDVELRQSPPIVDRDELAKKQQEYARAAIEWAAARTAERQPCRVDATRGTLPLTVHIGSRGVRAELPAPDGTPRVLQSPFADRWSLLPAFLAIGLAVLLGRVLPALFCACLAGAIVHVLQRDPSYTPGVVEAVTRGLQHFLGDALWRRSVCEDFYLRITLFVVFLFMTVAVITRNGGVHGLVHWLQRRVRGPVSAQLCTFLAGLAVFFDDYTNCLLVGTSMRPLCDASRVSRAKLAWIVDSTAAPVAGISVFSTWVTYEMSTYRAPLALVTRADGTPYVPDDAFEVFLATLPFRCYCLFTLAMVLLVIVMRRDFGPMLTAERRARCGTPAAPITAAPALAGTSAPLPGVPLRARNALLPLLLLVGGTIVGMLAMGLAATQEMPPASDWSERVRTVLSHSRSDVALLVASIAAWLLASALTLGQRLLSVRELVLTSLAATRTLWLAFGILFLAWSLGHLCQDLGTAGFLCASVRGAMHAIWLPVLLFLIAGAIAFATGTSFGTMAILLPNVVVLAHQLGTDAAFTGSAAAGGPALLLLCLGAVLEGAIFGDHCSPISDTTVLSSLGSQCDLLEHVRTQLPYALLGFATAALCGYVPLVLLGPHMWPWCLLGGVVAIAGFLRLFGRDAAAP